MQDKFLALGVNKTPPWGGGVQGHKVLIRGAGVYPKTNSPPPNWTPRLYRAAMSSWVPLFMG
eukprot:1613595-Amphidinium_carterae.1